MSRLDLTLVTLAVLYPACLPDPDFGTDSATGSGSGTASTGDASASTTGGVDSSTGASTPTTSGSGSGTTSTGPDATTTTGATDTGTSSSTSATTGGPLTPTCSGLLGDGKPWGRCPCDPGLECRVTDGGSVCVAACDATPCEFPGCFNGTCSASQCVWPCGSDADCLIDGTSCDLAASPPICTYA